MAIISFYFVSVFYKAFVHEPNCGDVLLSTKSYSLPTTCWSLLRLREYSLVVSIMVLWFQYYRSSKDVHLPHFSCLEEAAFTEL